MLTELRAGGVLRAPMSYDDYLALGETKHTEFYDGMVTVNPPTRRHVVINRRLTFLLSRALPAEYEVLPEAGWLAAPETLFIPDLMVVRLDAPGEDVIREAPLLVVEISSRSTRSEDLGRKMVAYAQGGAAWYWIVDSEEQTLAIRELSGGTYVLRRTFSHDDIAQVVEPLELTLAMTDLFA